MNIPVIATFMVGAAIGIITFSNILSWLLKRYHNQTIAVLAGFMLGSLNKVWPWKEVTQTIIGRHGELKPITERNILPNTYEQISGNESLVVGAIVIAIVGFALIFVIEGIGKKIQKS